MDEETGIYRGEVIAIMGGLLSIQQKLDRVLEAIEGDDDGEEEEEDPA